MLGLMFTYTIHHTLTVEEVKWLISPIKLHVYEKNW